MVKKKRMNLRNNKPFYKSDIFLFIKTNRKDHIYGTVESSYVDEHGILRSITYYNDVLDSIGI